MIRRAISACLTLLIIILTLIGRGNGSAAQPASLEAVRQEQCVGGDAKCGELDAIVFVHGVFGGEETFKNSETNFDWTERFPSRIKDRQVDVFRLSYKTALLSWAKENNPNFEDVAGSVMDALAPLRKREYRSIGFIAHSLGGNIVSTYIHMIKTKLGHPHRSQHAFVITLATPVLGSQIADLGSILKASLGMRDELLESLKEGNLYLKMLNEFRGLEGTRERWFVCRPVHLHAAYEKE